MSKAELYTDKDGDLIVALDGFFFRVSDYGRPTPPDSGPIDWEELSDSAFFAEVPEDLARLYIEHGCNLAEYELDRAIWAAEYVHQMSNRGAFVIAKDFARDASKAADYIVLSRWLAKGK